MADESFCFARHDFTAENEDELSFSQGERIRILQRDEQYGDGWFEGVNTAGEIGLFPQSYTSPDPPTPDSEDDRADSHTPEPQIAATMTEVQQALHKLQTERQDSSTRSLKSADRASLRTKDDASDDEDTGLTNGADTSPSKGMGVNHRAALAATAMANAEQAAKEEEAKAERRRVEDAAAYEKARSEGLIEGLQMSDESEDEEQLPLPVGMRTSLTTAPESVALPSSPVALSSPLEPAASPSIVVEGATSGEEGRPRAETVSSGYAESTYSEQSAPAPSPAIATAPLMNALPLQAREQEDAQEELKEEATASAQTNGDHSIVETTKHSTIGAVEAVGAGVAGAAALAAAAVGLNIHSNDEEPAATVASFPKAETAPPASTTTAPLEPAAVPSHVITAPSPVVASPPSPPIAERAVTPPPANLTPAAAAQFTASPERHVPSAIVTSQDAIRASPAASLTSATHSRSSSRLSNAPRPGGSIATGGTSLRGSTSEAYKQLPHDPTVWSVEDVVEWGKAKGFDGLTLAKFQEHEISGDVLLEMDVAMLKEIDLVAFGRRVHIYNAIKELKGRVPRTNRDVVSPALSGYEPDSPGNLSFASPGQSSFTFPSEDVQGLGVDDDGSSSFARPSSTLTRSISGSLQPRASIGAISSVPASPTGPRRSAASETVAQEPALEQPIPEEDVETDTQTTRKISPVIAAVPVVAAVRPAATRADSSPKFGSPKLGSRRSGNEKSDTSAPTSPLVGRKKKDSSSSDRNSFFGVPVGRSRKPPPRVPSAFIADSDGRAARPQSTQLSETRGARSRMNAMNASKRSTRLFGSFGGGSGSEKNAGIEGLRRTSGSTIGGSGREGPSSMSPKTVDAATSEMTRIQPEAVTDGSNLLERIGNPDYSGWMRKKGEKYNSWKQRFFVLKGIHLYWLKTESEQKVKGFINLRGYRIISDPDVHVGEFGFKIVHDHERTHFFSAAEQVTVRTWMKEIMKATIGRDYSDAVVSSCDIETMPLTVAQSMNPRPRPPSPTERARVQRERYAGTNPNTLTAKDAQILMEFSPGSPVMGGAGSPPLGGMRRSSSTNVVSQAQASPSSAVAPSLPPVSPPKAIQRTTTSDQELLAWLNSALPASTPLATDLSNSLRSGRILTRVVENLSGKSSDITDSQFDKYKSPASEGIPFDADYFETVFSVFDFLTAHVSTDDVSMNDMMTGNQAQLTILLKRIRSTFA